MSKSVNPKSLAERLCGKVPVGRDETKALAKELFSIVTEEVKTTGRMSLYGFGSFSTVPVKEQKRKNPRSGETMIIPAHRRIKFSPASAAAERINREYADLDAVILEDTKPEGLLVKADRYRKNLRVQPAVAEREMPTESPQVSKKREVPFFQPLDYMPSGIRRVVTAIIIEAALLVITSLIYLCTMPG